MPNTMLWPLAADDSGEGLRTPREGSWHSVVSPMESKESVTGEGGDQTSHCGEGTRTPRLWWLWLR